MAFGNFAAAAASVPSQVVSFFLAVYKAIKQASELGLEKLLCRALVTFETPDLSGGFVRKRWWSKCLLIQAPGSSQPQCSCPSIRRSERRQQKRLHWTWCLLNLSERFCRHGSLHKWRWEHGSFPSQQPHMVTGPDNGRRVIGASWPQLSLIACGCISAGGWERPETLWYWSCSPLIIVPTDLYRVPLTHQLLTAPIHLCSHQGQSAEIVSDIGWPGLGEGGGCQHTWVHVGISGARATTAHPATNSMTWVNSRVSPASSPLRGNSIKTGSRSLPVYHLLPSSSLRDFSLQPSWDPNSTPAMRFLYLVFAVFLLVSLATPGKMENWVRWADTSWNSFKITSALVNMVITIWGDCYNLARYFNDLFQGTMK